MTEPELQPQPENQHNGLKWALVVLVLGVLILSGVTLARPISQGGATPTETSGAMLTAETTTTMGSILTATTPTPAPTESLTPEEIGYTDGIIFFSTVLVLILLVGTLRETLHRKGH